ncbi:hypothetical protein FACS189481_4190 [Clostridia bacterium]|nr:hypothetical protein FACS189481_4190 [Clostridia bacterium]
MKSKKTLAFICGVVMITGTVCTPIVTANKFTDEVDELLKECEKHFPEIAPWVRTFTGTASDLTKIEQQLKKQLGDAAEAWKRAAESGELWDGNEPQTEEQAKTHPVVVWADSVCWKVRDLSGSVREFAPSFSDALSDWRLRYLRDPFESARSAREVCDYQRSRVAGPLLCEACPLIAPEADAQRPVYDFLFGATGKVCGDEIVITFPADAGHLVFREPFSTGQVAPNQSQQMAETTATSLVASDSTNGGQPLQNVSVNPAPTTDSALSGSTSADSITPNSLSKSTDSTATNLALTNSTLSDSIFGSTNSTDSEDV